MRGGFGPSSWFLVFLCSFAHVLFCSCLLLFVVYVFLFSVFRFGWVGGGGGAEHPADAFHQHLPGCLKPTTRPPRPLLRRLAWSSWDPEFEAFVSLGVGGELGCGCWGAAFWESPRKNDNNDNTFIDSAQKKKSVWCSSDYDYHTLSFFLIFFF